jgi:glycerol-3-phosphate dehydrogenase
MQEAQVLIIGGGAVGCMLARELSQYKVDVILVEKMPDVSFGLSKASNGYIYWGLMWQISAVLKSIALEGGEAPPSTAAGLKKEGWCRAGYELWKSSLFAELDIPYRWLPVLNVATDDTELKILNLLEAQCKDLGWPNRRLKREEVLSLEPNVTNKVIAGLYDDEWGFYSTYPWETVISVAENAQQNGVKFMLNTEVTGFSHKGGFQIVETTKGPIKTEFIINAAGADSLQVAKMAHACDFSLQFFKAHLIIMDKRIGNIINRFVGALAGPGKVKGLCPMQSGNLLLSAIYTPTNMPHDLATDKVYLDTMFSWCQEVVPSLSRRDIIAYHSVSRVYSARDPEEFIVEFSPNNPRFMNMVFRMPGISAAPAIIRDAVGMLADHGLPLTKKGDFNPYRKRIPQFSTLSDEERGKLIAQDPKYGHVVCRCETVTEGEIVEAIRRGATTLDGVKFRTRAGMGRCQGGFCGPRVVEILARELNIKPTEVTKRGSGSRILLHETKELSKVWEGANL